MVADVLLLGMTNFGAQSTFVSFEQAEEVEAKFRQAYYRRFGISSSTPRLCRCTCIRHVCAHGQDREG